MIVVTGTIITSVIINVTTAVITTALVERSSSSDDLQAPMWTDYNDYDGYLICDRVKYLLAFKYSLALMMQVLYSQIFSAIPMWHVLPTIINTPQ